MSERQTFRLRPRYKGVAAVAMGMGGVSVASGFYFVGLALSFPLVVGTVGLMLGAAYFASPTWRYEVVVDDAGLALAAHRRDSATSGAVKAKFRVAWTDVVRVVASPSTKTCFVDSGDPASSLLVPGDGAPAPYAIENRAALYEYILARVDPAVVTVVETLRSAAARTG